MKELKEAKEAYAKLAEAIATMEAKQKDATWPKVGEKYWYVSDTGAIDYSTWRDFKIDEWFKSIGNVFRTESDAQKELETRKTIAEFRAQPGREKFVVGKKNWCANMLVRAKIISIDYLYENDRGLFNTYFDSKESTQAAINAVGADRLLAASKWLSMGE